ncbi:MAG TPA: hypothetical protein VEJ41_00565 [Candidatus Acidoferrales bacterium]|nr:hypothetical protein [Candidatus Acidoferrales bacterium]
MSQKAFAFLIAIVVVAVGFMAPPLSPVVSAAQSVSPVLSTATCTTEDLSQIVAVYNFDSPQYRAAPENLPVGVRSYLAGLLTGRLNSCAALAGPTAAKSACTPNAGQRDPHELWEQLEFCQGILGLGPQAQPLVAAQEPTFYVLLSIGAGPGGPPAGTGSKATSTGSTGGGSSGGKGGGSGPATGSTATGSSVDSPSYFLLFVIAQKLERDVCARSGISVEDCDSQHPVAVIPESTWNLEDFQAQCINDPYIPNDPNNPYGTTGQAASAGHGTLGAIVLNGSMVTADGTFAVVTIYGSSEANYAAQVVNCNTSTPNLQTVWSDNISDGNKTTALSFFPIALAGTLLEANSAAHEVSQPAPNPSSSPSQLNTYITYQNDVAIGTFAAATQGLTLGNPSSGLTFRHTFEGWATKLATNLNEFCKSHTSQSVCRALKLPTSS